MGTIYLQEWANHLDRLLTSILSRLTAVEHAIGRLWDMVGYASGKTSYAPSPAPSAPILERTFAGSYTFSHCPKCQSSWCLLGDKVPIPGDPCPKCAAQKDGE
jgi:hypothetical protein